MSALDPHGTVRAVRARGQWWVRFLVPLAILGSSVPRAVAADATVLVLRNRSFPAEEARLIEALRIYTRDRDCRIVVAGDAPPSAMPDTVEAVARQVRGEGADLVVWVAKRSDGRLVYDLLMLRELDLRETELAPTGAIAAAEAVALKIRTLVSRRPAVVDGQDKPREPMPEAPAPAKPVAAVPRSAGTAPPPKAATVPAVSGPRTNDTPTPGPRPDTAPASTVSRGLAPSQLASWLSLGAAYGFVIPRDLDWVRHGLLLSAEVRLGERPLYLVADANLTARAESTAAGQTVSLDDLPFGLGLWRRWGQGRWGIAAGPRASAHVFHVSAVGLVDGRVGSTRRVSAGFGGMARLEMALRDTLKVYGGASLEALVPARYFTVSGDRVLATGPVLLGACVGLLLAVP